MVAIKDLPVVEMVEGDQISLVGQVMLVVMEYVEIIVNVEIEEAEEEAVPVEAVVVEHKEHQEVMVQMEGLV
jgi:hypothetical protein